MKSYIISIITASIILITTSYIYAQSPSTHDCSLVMNKHDLLMSVDKDLFPKEAVSRATKNLRAFCCEQKIIRNNEKIAICDPKDKPTQVPFPQSAYLFDHIIDIILRRLDGDESLIYPDVPVHPLGKQRREYITDIAKKPEGTLPLEIIRTIQKYRYDTTDQTHQLIDLYNRSCSVAFSIYQSIASFSPGAIQTSTLIQNKACEKLILSRILSELTYAKTILQLSTNQMTKQYLTNHITSYYLDSQLSTLQSTINQIVYSFQVVNRFVVEGTKMCSM